MDKVDFRDMFKKLIFIITHQQKDVHQVVIDILKTILILMLEYIWIKILNLMVEEMKKLSYHPT